MLRFRVREKEFRLILAIFRISILYSFIIQFLVIRSSFAIINNNLKFFPIENLYRDYHFFGVNFDMLSVINS